jgi:carbon monoxide dehydrogenase subunit G
MRVEGTFEVRTSRDRAWSFFLDPAELSTCIDDPHTIEVVDADHFKGTVKAGVAFIRGTFTWSATIKERIPPERAQIAVHGSGMGSAFDVVASFELSESSGLTKVAWRAEIVMSGTIASVGARVLQGTIDKKTNTFFENVREKLGAS